MYLIYIKAHEQDTYLQDVCILQSWLTIYANNILNVFIFELFFLKLNHMNGILHLIIYIYDIVDCLSGTTYIFIYIIT